METKGDRVDPQKKLKRKIENLLEEDAEAVMDALLSYPFWPTTLSPEKPYIRRSDDTDGRDDTISIFISGTGSRAGDTFIEIRSKVDSNSFSDVHCFRSGLGGTRSPHVHNALRILARAIDLDNQYLPDPPRKGEPHK